MSKLFTGEGQPTVPPNVILVEKQANSDQVVLLKQQLAKLTQACLAADALISSLLVYRPGATDELLIEVRDFLRAAVAERNGLS
jgi:hypothetical protein